MSSSAGKHGRNVGASRCSLPGMCDTTTKQVTVHVQAIIMCLMLGPISHVSGSPRRTKNPPESNNAFCCCAADLGLLTTHGAAPRSRSAMATSALRKENEERKRVTHHPTPHTRTSALRCPHAADSIECSFFGHRHPIPQELNRVIIICACVCVRGRGGRRRMSEKRYAQGLYQRGSGRAGEHSIKGEDVISNCFYGLSSIGSAHSALKIRCQLLII